MSSAVSSSLGSRQTVLGGHPRAPGATPVVAPAAARRSRQVSRPQALGGALLAASAPSAVGAVVNVASALAWGSALIMAGKLFWQQQSEPKEGSQTECETCGGTGYVQCWCHRWSDGDSAGCGTCRGSGRMTCSSCSGGGTAVPIEARIVISPTERTSNFRRYQ